MTEILWSTEPEISTDFLQKACPPILEDQLVQAIMNVDSSLRLWLSLI